MKGRSALVSLSMTIVLVLEGQPYAMLAQANMESAPRMRLELPPLAAALKSTASPDLPPAPELLAVAMNLPPNGLNNLQEFLNAIRDMIRAGGQIGTLSPAARLLLGELGAYLGLTAEAVIQNWGVIGPALQHSGALLSGGTRVVAGSLLRCAPTVLLAVTVAGLIPPAIYQARLAAIATESREEARNWQMDQAQLIALRRERRLPIRLPSYLATADIFVAGPSAGQVAEGPIQNYIVAAFEARANVRGARERAAILLNLIAETAARPVDD